MSNSTPRRCNVCHEMKTFDDFNNDRSRPQGKRYNCKSCATKSKGYAPKSLRPKPPDGKRQCTKCKEYKAATPEFFTIDSRRVDGLGSRCRDCENQRTYGWITRHPEQRRANEQRYNARKAALPATLTCQEWESILADYGYACAYCGKKWFEVSKKLQQDHVIPVAQGGGYTADNIVPACKSCNCKKNGRTPEQAGMILLNKVR